MAGAGLAATLVLLFSAGRGQAQPSSMSMSMSMSMSHPELSAKAVAFRSSMDKLWEDHITWTRMVIVDFAAGLPDLKTAEARLLRNQADIGNAIKPFYGRRAGNALTRLLRTHILEAVPVLEDAKADNTAKVAQDERAWHANAHQIAVFLSKANPRNWPLGKMDEMMNRHLALTTNEAVARLTGNWPADVAAYDKVHAEILEMSAMLSGGIIRQFPNRF
ncbi:MAG: glycosyltransferase [Gaiellaceae bacterium]